jgi:hypothetical protein
MTSRTAGVWTFTANLAAFLVCTGVAFARNINALFFHYDGANLLVGVLGQLECGQLAFSYTNNFVQSIGNTQRGSSSSSNGTAAMPNFTMCRCIPRWSAK